MQREPVLHHYPGSPFSEKVRLILGRKRLAWRSVQIPVVMPKPDLVALTGGYRRTPVLQVGADVYCDSALIARRLDRLAPEPPLFPVGAPLAPLLAQWADATLFWTVIPWAMQPAGIARLLEGVPPWAAQAFAADRARFSAGWRRPPLADARNDLDAFLAALAAQLARGGPFLFGQAPCIADFSVAHCAWFLRRAGAEIAAPLDAHRGLGEWLDRMLAPGHGASAAMTSTDAVALAASAPGHEPAAFEPGLGFEPGAAVTVTPTDVGRDPVAGTLVGLSADEAVVARDDPRAGRVHVHFPRHGFRIDPQEPAAS